MAPLMRRTRVGRTTSFARGRARSTRAPQRSRRTSSASGCSGFHEKHGQTARHWPRRNHAEVRPVSGAHNGVRVLDLSSGIAGPMAAMLLADYGADVVKVEPPSGDPG